MTNNKEQTAVEWLQSIELERDLTLADWKQAKEMHKEEIIAAHFNAQPFNGTMLNNAEQYYNQTFGGTNAQ